MSDFRQEEELDKSYDSKLMARLLTYAIPYWRQLLVCVVLLGASVSLDLLRDYLIKDAVDLYLKPGENTPAAQAGLIKLGLTLMGALAAMFVVNYGQVQLLQFTGQRIIYRIRTQVFGHLQKLHLKFFDSNPVGRLVTRVTNDTETLNEMYTSVLVNLFRDLFMLVGVAILMFRTNAKLAAVSLALVPLVAWYSRIFTARARNAWREVRLRLARINAFLAEHINGMKVIQLFAREEQTFQEFKEENDGYFRASWGQLMVWAVFRPVLDLLANLAIALVFWYGGMKAMSGEVTVGVVVLFVSLVRRFFEPLMALAEKFNILQSAMASSERLFRLLDTPAGVTDPASPSLLPAVPGAVEFRNVWFSYNDDEWVLRDVDFTVSPGQTVAFVGHTGAGKSSIINLLTRFYDVQRGEVLVDGVNVKNLAQRDLRRSVGLVSQDVFMFTGDIQSNIRLGNDQIGDETVRRAAVAMEADRFIHNLPQGYAEPVVERGATLSVGQRQLISLARALAFNPAILVLDEPTASIDSETEATIQRALKKLTQGRTTFIVAHRLSTIVHADQILVLHRGRIRERGTHPELIEQQGLYYKLWRLQFEEQQEKALDNVGAV